MLLISRYGLDARAYHRTKPYPTWEKSDIRRWLNDDFLNTAFTQEEQKAIEIRKISTPSYSKYGFFNSGGADTKDKIWLLSEDEAWSYINGDRARRTEATAYTVAKGVYKYSNGYCEWWLRSPGYESGYAFYVSGDGSVFASGNVDDKYFAVRPALWLNLDTAGF